MKCPKRQSNMVECDDSWRKSTTKKLNSLVVRDHQMNPTTRNDSNEESNVGGIQNLFSEILGIQTESSTENLMTSSTDFSRGSTIKNFEGNGKYEKN